MKHEEKTTEQHVSAIVARAAENSASAAAAAVEAAKTAAANAATAAEAAAKSATAIAVVATDTSWMKGTLTRVESTINEMSKAFVTAVQHQDVLKKLEDHEVRINTLETSNTTVKVMLSIGISILSLLVSLLIYHLFQK